MIKSDRTTRATISRDLAAGFAVQLAAVFIAALGTASVATAQVTMQSPSAVTEQLFDSVNGSLCTITAISEDGKKVNRGSGFILKGSGLLVTNAHVVAGLDTASARCGGRTVVIERVVKYDRNVDLVVAQVSGLNVSGLSLATNNSTRPGSQIFVFGSPFGLEGTMTPGLTSGKRNFEGRTYIQISAPISAGSSGGPVTDLAGNVIGVTVASLEIGQNINFAIPAAAITALPDTDLSLPDLVTERSVVATAPLKQQPTPIEEPIVTTSPAFRGHAFGSPCGDIAVSEYERKRPIGGEGGLIRFNRWYAGKLEMDVRLLDTPVTVFYNCDERYGMLGGYYRIHGYSDTVNRIAGLLRSKYGSGLDQAISEYEAEERGCRWNFSLPGTDWYRPSEWVSWRVDDRFHVDMLICGGRSKLTFLFYSDPVLLADATRAGDGGSQETEL